MDAPRGTIIAYATSPGKVASDGDARERNSPYTKHLLRAMQSPNKPIELVFKDGLNRGQIPIKYKNLSCGAAYSKLTPRRNACNHFARRIFGAFHVVIALQV